MESVNVMVALKLSLQIMNVSPPRTIVCCAHAGDAVNAMISSTELMPSEYQNRYVAGMKHLDGTEFDGVCDGVIERVEDLEMESVGEAVILAVRETEMDSEAVWEKDSEGDNVAVADALLVKLDDWVGDAEMEMELVMEPEKLMLCVMLAEGVMEGVTSRPVTSNSETPS